MNFRQFSCPQVPGDEGPIRAITAFHAVSAVEMLLVREESSLERRSTELRDFLQAWLKKASDVDFETAWDLSFGRVLRALESREVDAIDVLAEVGLRLAARGHRCDWSATLREQRCLVWDNEWLLPKGSGIAVKSDGTIAHVHVKTSNMQESACTFRRVGPAWLAEGAEPLLLIGQRRRFALFPPEAIPQDMIAEDDFHTIFEFPAVSGRLALSLSEGLAILDHVPEYRAWVDHVLRGILVCKCHESRTRSSSWMHAPGMVLASWSPNAIEMAEMLVHECSHQYFYLAARLGDVVDGSDKALYYSPTVQRERPLGKILIGYHAFANLLLFYRALLNTEFAGDGYCIAMEARLSEEVAELERPLRDNPALTSLGLNLCQPLIQVLQDSRTVRLSV